MANRVQSKNIFGYMKVDGVYINIFCGKSLNFTLNQDELETTSVGSGTLREYKAGLGDATFDVSGVTILDNTESRIAITYLQQQSVRQQLQDWKIKLVDDDGSEISYTFSGIIRTTSFDKSIPGYSSSNLSVRVSGDITIDPVAPPPTTETVLADYWDTVNGQNYIDGDSTGNTDGTVYQLDAADEILHVEVEDMIMYAVTGTPTAGEPEYRFVTSPVKIETGVTFDGSQRVYVMWKRLV